MALFTVYLGLEGAGVVGVLVLGKHLLGDVHLDDLPQLEVLLGQPEHVVTGLLMRPGRIKIGGLHKRPDFPAGKSGRKKGEGEQGAIIRYLLSLLIQFLCKVQNVNKVCLDSRQ